MTWRPGRRMCTRAMSTETAHFCRDGLLSLTNRVYHKPCWMIQGPLTIISDSLCVFCHSDKFGHFVIYLASENQGAQFDSSNFLRGQFFFQTDPPSHQLVGRHQRRFSVIWSHLKDTVRDVPLLTQIAHPMKLSAALFVFNDVLVSWLLGGGGGGEGGEGCSWNYVFTSCWWSVMKPASSDKVLWGHGSPVVGFYRSRTWTLIVSHHSNVLVQQLVLHDSNMDNVQ